MKNFRTYDLAKEFYIGCQGLGLRAPEYLIDYHGRLCETDFQDRKRFYAIAMGSLRENQVILDLCGYKTQLQKSDAVAACLYRLIQNPGGNS